MDEFNKPHQLGARIQKFYEFLWDVHLDFDESEGADAQDREAIKLMDTVLLEVIEEYSRLFSDILIR